MKKDKTQGVVFVLPKSKEFFGRIQDDFQRGHFGQMPAPKRTHEVSEGVREAEAKQEIESLKDIKENLTKLSKLHTKLKSMLDELDDLVKEDK